MEKNEIQIKLPWMLWDKIRWLQIKFLYENIYHPVCIQVLQKYLNMEKKTVMRKGKRTSERKCVTMVP